MAKQHVITFNKLNTDVADKMLPQGDYLEMVNCRPNNTNNKAGGVVESIPSTYQVTPPYFNGQDVVYIGGCSDNKRNSIISFRRGGGVNFITSFNTKTKVESVVARIAAITVDFSKRVTHACVLDDLLFWIDGASKMRRINIVTAAAYATANPNNTTHYSSDDLLIDKYPPLFPPTAAATIDGTFNGNNIYNDMFQFAYAWEYETKEISSWSPFSKTVMPVSNGSEDIVFPNNRIDVTMETGSASVKKIYVGYRKGESRPWQLAEILDKTKLSIANDTDYVYRFYNNKYVSALVEEEVLAYTNNPFYEAGTLALSKDNFVIYGLVKDGLQKPNVTLTLSYSLGAATSRTAVHKLGAIHEYGVIFRDKNGRTDGVNGRATVELPFYTNLSTYFQSIKNSGNIPTSTVFWDITGSAPLWAETMSLVYLGNKTMSSFVQYTLTDIEDVGIYTYLDISLLNTIQDSVSILDPGRTSSIIPAYTWTKGDRIRFITDKNGNVLNGTYDYEILGEVTEVTDSAGNVYYPNNIYVNKIDNWNSLGLGEKSMFEIYSPKKEFEDGIFYEVGQVYQCVNGTILKPPLAADRAISTGDTYAFNREMPFFKIGELVADKEQLYDYTGRIGFTPVMNVVKSADGIQSSSYTINETAGSFYHNTSGIKKKVTLTGDYNFTSESNDGYWFKIRLRTAGATISDYTMFEEPNHTSASQRVVYHQGTINKTFVVDNNQYLALYFDNRDLDSSHLIFRTPPTIRISAKISDNATGDSITSSVESKNYSDYFDSNEHSLGRPYVEIEEDLRVKNNIVWTGKYFADTDINDTNKISGLNVKYVPYEFGAITAMRVKGDTLKVFTPTKEISFYLGKEQYVDGSGERRFAMSSNDVGTMNVYDSDYGTENPESILENSDFVYYYDRKNACIVRTGNNGQADICEAGVKTYFRNKTAEFNFATEATRAVYMGYNDKNKEVIVCVIIEGLPSFLVYNERDGIWTHSLEYEGANVIPQGMAHFGENLAIYANEKTYLNEQGTGYCNFFGTQKYPFIKCVCNQEPKSTKIFQAVSLQGSDPMEMTITTEARDMLSQGQETIIRKGRFKQKEGIYFSDIPRNLKNKNGNLNMQYYATGDPMRGRVATIVATSDTTDRFQLDEITTTYIDSPTE